MSKGQISDCTHEDYAKPDILRNLDRKVEKLAVWG